MKCIQYTIAHYISLCLVASELNTDTVMLTFFFIRPFQTNIQTFSFYVPFYSRSNQTCRNHKGISFFLTSGLHLFIHKLLSSRADLAFFSKEQGLFQCLGLFLCEETTCFSPSLSPARRSDFLSLFLFPSSTPPSELRAQSLRQSSGVSLASDVKSRHVSPNLARPR